MKRMKRHLGFAVIPDGEPPSEFQIFPYGPTTFQWEGEPEVSYVLTPEYAQQAVANAQQGNTLGELPIDYDHRSERPVANGPTPAAGWFNLEARADGLYAINVRWTPAAYQAVQDKEYRYFSPTFYTDESGFIRAVSKLALSNNPATVGLEPLMASTQTGQGDPMREKLITQLGLASDATDEQIEAALLALQASAAQITQAQELLTSAGITAEIGSDEATGQALAAAANAQLASRVNELETELATLHTATADTNASELVESALTDGKIHVASKGFWLEQAKKNPKAVRAHLASLKPGAVVPTETIKTDKTTGGDGQLSEVELQVIEQTGVSKEAFLASRAKIRG